MRETETIWMNGEFIDWADAKVHVGVHGLHYGTGVFEGIRCYETPDGPAVFRLREHLQRLHNSAELLYMELPYTVDEIRTRHARADRPQRAAGVLHPPVRVLRLRRAGRAHEGQPGRGRDHELAVGELPRRRERQDRHPHQDLLLEAHRPEHDPARGQGDRDLPQLDARRPRGPARRLRRGDHAQRRGVRRRRAGREHLRRQGRQDRDAAALDVDPARDHARERHPDRAGPRLRRRGGEPDSHRPLPRRRDLHDRHRRRGDAGALGRRPRDRCRTGHARAADRPISTRCAASPSAGVTGSTASRSPTRLPPRREGRHPEGPALVAVRRRAGRGARARGAPVGPALARAGDRPLRGALRGEGRRALRGRRVVRHRRAAPALRDRRPRERATR